MKKLNSFNGLQEVMYSGQLETKQFPTVATVDYTKLSATQYKMFKHIMVGLDMYTPQELYAMNSSKKAKIFKRHKQAQTMLNRWKQELTNELSNRLLGTLFPKSQLIQELTADNSTSDKFVNTLSFKDLGISKVTIINKLISENLLPTNFATL
jgi:hypothetical protein